MDQSKTVRFESPKVDIQAEDYRLLLIYKSAEELLKRLKWTVERLEKCGEMLEFTLGTARSLNDCRELIAELEGK